MWNLTSDGSSGVPFLTLTSYVTLGKFPNLCRTQFLLLENESKVGISVTVGCEDLTA